MDYYAPLFFSEISSIQPGAFCQKVDLCQKIAMFSAQMQEDSCELCHHAVSEVINKLKDPDMQVGICLIGYYKKISCDNIKNLKFIDANE